MNRFYKIIILTGVALLIAIFGITGIVVSDKWGRDIEVPLTFGNDLIREQIEMQKIYSRAKAIAKCEGLYVKDSLPQRRNNPGSLSGANGLYTYETEVEGWIALYGLLYKSRDQTIDQIATWYATDPNWPACVKSKL